MTPASPIERQFQDVKAAWERRRVRPVPATRLTDFGLDALDAGRADLAIALLEPASKAMPGIAPIWQILALAWRDEQDMDKAAAAFARADRLAPQDLRIVMGRAQTHMESGEPATALFARALALSGGHPDVLRNHAAAAAIEGDAATGQAMLEQLLLTRPDWIDGHEALAQMRWSHGAADRHDESLRSAIAAHPRHVELRMALYRRLMAVKAHDAAKAVIDAARRELPSPLFDAAAAAWEAEHGDRAQAHAAFCAMPTAARDQMALPHVRLLLRMQRFDEAERVAITALATAQRDAIWPYLSTIWRLTGNSNAAWLDGDPPYIRTFDLGLSDAERDALATVLRGLHARAANFPGQSVRGGTQTDQPLFFRAEPEIRRAKAAALDAVRRYIAMLPPPQTGHPLLGVPRNHLLFEGSWSVLLQAAGFHATHTHPRGWISAVCYISRPAQDALGPAPAGWLELGTPPPELGLSLPPLRQVEPIAGRIALFPSTMWHHTIGFSAGERLTIAFDVRPPRR